MVARWCGPRLSLDGFFEVAQSSEPFLSGLTDLHCGWESMTVLVQYVRAMESEDAMSANWA